MKDIKLTFSDQQIRQLFGSEDAENEDSERFHEYFVQNRAFDNLIAPLPLRIIVGHKGVGKSALLRFSFERDVENKILSVFLKPDDLSDLLKVQAGSDINSLIDAWKTGIKEKVAEKAVEQLTEGTVDKIDNSKIAVGARKLTAVVSDALRLIKPEIHDATQMALYEHFLSDQVIHIYIDDIDRGWSARPQDVTNISALINALKDISSKDSNIKCKIALRTDVYYLVRTSDESTDKIEQDIIRLTWNNDDILKLIAFRISTFFQMDATRDKVFAMTQNQISRDILSKVMDEKFQGRGKWSNERIHRILMSLCRKRPRDLVKMLHAAARRTADRGGSKISTLDFQNSFEEYSEGRLQDLFNEFRSEVANIDQFIMQFRPTKYQRTTAENYHYTNDAIITRIKNAKGSVPIRFSSGRPVTDKAILTFLYKIDFIIAKFNSESGADWKYFDQSRFLAHEYADFGNSWEVHPAYRWALQPNDVQGVIDNIALQ